MINAFNLSIEIYHFMNKYRTLDKKREIFNKISMKYSVIVTILELDDQFMMITA